MSPKIKKRLLFFAGIVGVSFLFAVVIEATFPGNALSVEIISPAIPKKAEKPDQPEEYAPPDEAVMIEFLIRPLPITKPKNSILPAEFPGPLQPKSAQRFGQKYGRMVDDFHEGLSRRFTNSATWLDSFFREEKQDIEENKSYTKLGAYFSHEEKEGFDFKMRVRIRLVLPQFENKMHVLLSGASEEDSDSETTTEDTHRIHEINTNKGNLTASLRYFFRQTLRENFSMRVGLQFRNITPILLLEPRFRSEKRFDIWTVRMTQSLKWYSDEGFQSTTHFDLEREFSKKVFFRASAEGNWYENDIGYFYNFGCSLYHQFNFERVLEYRIDHNFRTRQSTEPSNFIYKIKYRRRLWREWLYFEIAPQVSLDKEHNYKTNPGIFVKFDVIVGPHR